MSDEMLEADYEDESDQSEFDTEQEYYGEAELENPLDEVEEMEYAAELLEITDEQELDQFLGKLISRVSRAAGGIIRSPAGKALGGMLKSAAKKALPIAGRAVGTYFGGPAGGAIGGKLASAAGGIFGLELEGLSGEDQEFEVARRFVRLAASATQKAAQAPAGAPPQAAARSALAAAARRHAPGLLSPSVGGAVSAAYGGGRARSGRWVRRGRKIILLGA
jgi:hypothetical protein